ncbi:MAG: hypothetical protein JNM25_14080 [Planctomycetes bacterium]|nr:hypothetical protein [Planctomycetota bacterium]
MRLLILCTCVLATSLTAQTTISLVAATPIGALTSDAGGVDTFVGIPQGQAIGSSPNNVFLSTNQSPGGDYLSATTIIYPTLAYQQAIGFNFFERANARGATADAAGSTSATGGTGATFGAHAVLATFANAPGTVGRVVVSWRNNGATSGGTTFATVDIGDDGTAEVAQANPGEFSFPYTIGASGQVVVRVACECRSNGAGTSAMVYTWTEMYCSFKPDLTAACTFTNYGAGCNGVQLGGADLVVGTTRTIVMLGTGCYPNDPVVVAMGSNQLALPLFNGCSLLCNAEGMAVVAADATGNATWLSSIPSTLHGTWFLQFLPISNPSGMLTLSASNGVRLDCN